MRKVANSTVDRRVADGELCERRRTHKGERSGMVGTDCTTRRVSACAGASRAWPTLRTKWGMSAYERSWCGSAPSVATEGARVCCPHARGHASAGPAHVAAQTKRAAIRRRFL